VGGVQPPSTQPLLRQDYSNPRAFDQKLSVLFSIDYRLMRHDIPEIVEKRFPSTQAGGIPLLLNLVA
jgi:hypothetical protein